MDDLIGKIYLKPSREKSLLRRHPWIYSGAVARTSPRQLAPGATVEVFDAQNNFLGRGAWSDSSQLCCRIWTFEENEAIDEAFFVKKIEQAVALRQILNLPNENCNAYRLVEAESDGLPGIVVDCYENFAVLQCSTQGAERFKAMLLAALKHVLPNLRGIYERSDLSVRKQENLPEVRGLLWGEEPPELLEIQENCRRYLVDIRNGHKTGFYCDQRDNRDLVQSLAQGRDVLNLFSFTGGFGVAAALGGAKSVVNVDSSAGALALGKQNFERNNIDASRVEDIEADCFSLLRKFRGEHREFDLIVLDPPKLVDSQKALMRGARAYKDAALQSMHLLKKGGFLFTFSCSGLMEEPLFAKITADAALDAHSEMKIIRRLSQSCDHVVDTAFPEGRYLKGFLLIKK